jgi:hypothetical protein
MLFVEKSNYSLLGQFFLDSLLRIAATNVNNNPHHIGTKIFITLSTKVARGTMM